jgi:hypothetical protein
LFCFFLFYCNIIIIICFWRLFRLFQLYDPPVNAKKQEKVATLLRLYLDEDSSAEPSKRAAFGKSTINSKIYTVAMLNPLFKKPGVQRESNDDQHSQGNKSSTEQAPVIDEWTLCSGNYLII